MNIPAGTGSIGQPSLVTATEIAVAVVKKTQDASKAAGQAMVQLISQVPSGDVGRHLNVYA